MPVGMVGGATTVALLIAEGVLRLAHLAPTDGLATVDASEFRAVPGIFAPAQDLIDRRDPHLPYHVTIDSLGFRGKDFPKSKPPGELRILFTGDSFTFGDFVDDDATLPAQLERRLTARCGDVRVVNAGLGDATIVEEAHLIERGLTVSPDLVILLFSENDIDDLNRVSTWDRLADNRRTKSRFPFSLVYPVLRRTALWNLALKARAQERVDEHPVRIDWSAQGQESITPRLREEYRQDLGRVRDSLTARGIPLVFIAYPSHYAVLRTTMRGQMTWVAQTARGLNLPVVNLLTPLVASGLGPQALYLLPFDGHPSPRGYEVASAYLADRLTGLEPLQHVCAPIAANPPPRTAPVKGALHGG
ncbi:MAG TPA: SGNH/GDSL hydrolase family protein [Gemmatimonadales bacterium]|nr:SGNH/GDSL hydrolase family protein [Gemmatimonadales bacterium]